MPIELICKGCSRKLRVSDEHAGKHARCPQCGEINPIPAASGSSTSASDSFGGDLGSGPANLPSSSPFPAAPAPFTPPSNPFGEPAFPMSGGAGSTVPTAPTPLSGQFTWTPPMSSPKGGSPNPFSDQNAPVPYGGVAGVRPTFEPHRAGMILAFGILGWFFCLIFGIIAWVMGSEDLRKMRRGTMDPSGMGMTQAGMILGMIQCGMIGLSILAFIFLLVIGVLNG